MQAASTLTGWRSGFPFAGPPTPTPAAAAAAIVIQPMPGIPSGLGHTAGSVQHPHQRQQQHHHHHLLQTQLHQQQRPTSHAVAAYLHHSTRLPTTSFQQHPRHIEEEPSPELAFAPITAGPPGVESLAFRVRLGSPSADGHRMPVGAVSVPGESLFGGEGPFASHASVLGHTAGVGHRNGSGAAGSSGFMPAKTVEPSGDTPQPQDTPGQQNQATTGGDTPLGLADTPQTLGADSAGRSYQPPTPASAAATAAMQSKTANQEFRTPGTSPFLGPRSDTISHGADNSKLLAVEASLSGHNNRMTLLTDPSTAPPAILVSSVTGSAATTGAPDAGLLQHVGYIPPPSRKQCLGLGDLSSPIGTNLGSFWSTLGGGHGGSSVERRSAFLFAGEHGGRRQAGLWGGGKLLDLDSPFSVDLFERASPMSRTTGWGSSLKGNDLSTGRHSEHSTGADGGDLDHQHQHQHWELGLPEDSPSASLGQSRLSAHGVGLAGGEYQPPQRKKARMALGIAIQHRYDQSPEAGAYAARPRKRRKRPTTARSRRRKAHTVNRHGLRGSNGRFVSRKITDCADESMAGADGADAWQGEHGGQPHHGQQGQDEEPEDQENEDDLEDDLEQGYLSSSSVDTTLGSSTGAIYA